MLRLLGVVLSIGLADSLNPSTIAPALYLACGERARRRVAEFTLSVFAVYLAGGALIALGPGQLLLALIPHPHRTARYTLEVAVGVTLLIGAALLWRHRGRLSRKRLPSAETRGRSSALLGATITAIELPTAFPYFAAIATIVGSGIDVPRQILLLFTFNICFVLPLIVMLAILTFAGDSAQRVLTNVRRFIERHWPQVAAGVALAAGVLVVLLGATGFAARGRGHFGRFARHFRHTISP